MCIPLRYPLAVETCDSDIFYGPFLLVLDFLYTTLWYGGGETEECVMSSTLFSSQMALLLQYWHVNKYFWISTFLSQENKLSAFPSPLLLEGPFQVQ